MLSGTEAWSVFPRSSFSDVEPRGFACTKVMSVGPNNSYRGRVILDECPTEEEFQPNLRHLDDDMMLRWKLIPSLQGEPESLQVPLEIREFKVIHRQKEHSNVAYLEYSEGTYFSDV